MNNDEWNAQRVKLEHEVAKAVSTLFQHTGSTAFSLPVCQGVVAFHPAKPNEPNGRVQYLAFHKQEVLTPYTVIHDGVSTQWYLRRDVDALLATEAPQITPVDEVERQVSRRLRELLRTIEVVERSGTRVCSVYSVDSNLPKVVDGAPRPGSITVVIESEKTKPRLTSDAAMGLAAKSYAYSSDGRTGKPAPATYMTAANLLRFFELATKDFQP